MADTFHPHRKADHHAPPVPSLHLPTGAAFHSVFDSSGEALLVIDPTGTIYKANRRARELLRMKEASLRSAVLSDFVSNIPADRVKSFWTDASPNQREHNIEASLSSGFPVRVTLRATLPGSSLLLLCLEEGSLVRRADLKSRHLEAELRSVLDSLQVGVILLDPTGEIRFSNARFQQLFSLSPRLIRESRDFEALHTLIDSRFRDPSAFSAPWRSSRSAGGEAGNDELELLRPAPRVIERFYRPVLDSEGRAIGWFELYSDVTGERQIQSKMLQTEKMAALGQLVSGIAHELNNPLTAIMGYAQLLLGHGLQPSQFAEAKNVYHEAERARRIVKNLLYFARENKPERTRVDVNEIVERTIALRSYELRVEDIIVECDLAPGLPHTMADPYQLQQVILNLVVNAEQALLEDRGRGHVWIRTRHIFHGTGRVTGESILLEVSDDGPGIPPAIASRIFDPFFTTKTAGLGTGLGLSIVYGIVHQHGGEVAFENKPGGGAKFTVELPIVHAPEAKPVTAEPKDSSSTGSPLSRRFLVVEDEPTVAQLIVDVLREDGHYVESVLDSQEGLTRLSRGEFDLVICDLRMPRLDGPAFYDALVRAGSPMRDKIIFITGDTLAARSLKFLESKNLPYLAKPFLVEELKLAVQAVLCGNHHHSEAIHSAELDSGAPGRTLDPVHGVVRTLMTLPDHSPLHAIADELLAQHLSRELERVARARPGVVVTDLLALCEFANRFAPGVIILDADLPGREPLDGLLRQLTAAAPVILIAPPERQFEVARLVAGGEVEFVTRVADFVPLVVSLAERRLRWADMSASMLALPWGATDADLATIFRHEINNPLTGILGNAELVLTHRDHLSAVDTQRLQTVVDLAVRLRETVRRLSNAWESQNAAVKSA